MKFRYIGDPNSRGDGPDVVRFYGVDFPKGKPVQVEDATLIRKLGGNSHFEEVKERGNHKGRPRTTGAGKAGDRAAERDPERDGPQDGD